MLGWSWKRWDPSEDEVDLEGEINQSQDGLSCPSRSYTDSDPNRRRGHVYGDKEDVDDLLHLAVNIPKKQVIISS